MNTSTNGPLIILDAKDLYKSMTLLWPLLGCHLELSQFLIGLESHVTVGD